MSSTTESDPFGEWSSKRTYEIVSISLLSTTVLSGYGSLIGTDLGSETSRRIRSLNPMRKLANRCDEPGAYIMFGVGLIVTVGIVVPTLVETAVMAVMALLWIEGFATFDDDNDEEIEVDHARELYVSGEISIEEFESRLDVLLDEDRRQVRETVESIPLIGPERSSRIASRFSSRELRAADVDELCETPGIGESLAVEIVEEVESR